MDARSSSMHQRENGKVHVNATNISVVSLPTESEPVLDIIFVHGLQGHPFHTWAAKPRTGPPTKKTGRFRRLFQNPLSSSAANDTHRQKVQDGFFWPRDALPEYCPWARILTWGYDSKVTGVRKTVNQNSLYEHARDLIFTLKRNLVPKRPIIFVTHSLGGVVVKDALSFSHGSNDLGTKSVVQNTAAILFLGTPHRGSHLAELAETARRIVSAVGMDTNSRMLDSLGLRNAELDRVQTSFSNVWHTYGFRVKTFQEGLGFKPISAMDMNKKVVDNISSALGDAREEAETLQANHTEMCRFSDAGDQDAVKVLEELRVIYNWVLDTWRPKHVPNAPVDDLTRLTPPVQESHPALDGQLPSSRDVDCMLTAILDSLEFPGIIANHPVTSHNMASLDAVEKLWSAHLSAENNSKKSCRLLWIKGSLGSGKSTLMRGAFLRHVTEGHYTAAFFCDTSANDELLYSASGMFRSLLYQLLPICSSEILRHGELNNTLKTKYNRAKYAQEQIEWVSEELIQLLQVVIGKISDRNIVLFIDALDQYPEADRMIIIDFLEHLTSKDCHVDSRVHIWVSSRDQVRLLPAGFLSIQIESINWEDISDYVDAKLKLYPKINPDEFAEFKVQLKTRSSGNFLWVVLVVDIIRLRINRAQYNIKSLEIQLDELPERLYELYHTMLEEVQEDRSIRLKFFQWAAINGDLTLEDWQHILPLLDQPTPDSFRQYKNSRFWGSNYSNVGDHVSYLSLGFFRASLPLNDYEVSVDAEYEKSIDGAAGSMDSRSGNSTMVRPIHESVRIFFTQHDGFRALVDSGRSCSILDGYTTILHTCIDFISLKDFDLLVETRQRAFSAGQTRRSTQFPDGRPRKNSRSRSVASFSSATSMRSGWLYSWSDDDYDSVDGSVDAEADPQPQPLVSQRSLELSAHDGGMMISEAEMTEFRLNHLWSLESCRASYSRFDSSDTSLVSEISEYIGTTQQLGTVFLNYVNSNFLRYCRLLDDSAFTPESIIHRLQNDSLWNRWLCLNEVDPSTLKLSEWAEIEQLFTWADYLSDTKTPVYDVMARKTGISTEPDDWKDCSMSLRRCSDLGDCFIPRVAELSDGELVGNFSVNTQSDTASPADIFCHRLLDALEWDRLNHNRFVPMQYLRQLFTPNVIREILESTEGVVVASDDVAAIYRSFLRIFAILICIEKPASIRLFLDESIDDDFLPMAQLSREESRCADQFFASLKTGNPAPLRRDNLKWRRSVCDEFLWIQHIFLNPFLTQHGNDVYHYKIYGETPTLPIVEVSPWGSDQDHTSKVRFSPYSADFSSSQNKPQNWFLLHTIHANSRSTKYGNWEKFLSQVYTWQHLKYNKHYDSNILGILCTIELLGGKSFPLQYTFIHPCPEGDLRSLFNCDSQAADFNLSWLSAQMINMAKALAAVNDVSKIGKPKLPCFKYLRSAHLQHSDFLWFHGCEVQLPGYLVLSNLPDHIDFDLLPPEWKDLRYPLKRTRNNHLLNAARIWSLGAIWLDMIIWHLKGQTEVLGLRKKLEKDGFNFGSYFETFVHANEQQKVVSPVVLSSIADLRSTEGPSLCIGSILDVIEHGMLVIDPQDRFSAEELVELLVLTFSISEL